MKESYLKQCHTLYKELFSDPWLALAYVEADEKVILNSFSSIVDFENECFFLISKSVLCGEYISIDKFSDELKEFISTTEIEQNEGQPKVIEKYYEVTACLNDLLKHYTGFISFAKEKFITNSSGPSYVVSSSKTSISSVINDVYYTFHVCYYDYDYPLLEEELDTFISIYWKINNRLEKDKKENFIFDILYYKCNYILKRINRKFDYSVLDKLYKISPDELEVDFLQSLIDKQINLTPLEKGDIITLEKTVESKDAKPEDFVRLSWSMAKDA